MSFSCLVYFLSYNNIHFILTLTFFIFNALPCSTIDIMLTTSRSVKQVNEHIASNMITNVMSTYSVRVGIAAEMQIDIMQETSEWAS